ncbi:hypothetical protein AB0I28_29580 [Phytomonospora sp. NPDC050363]|uniref:NAD(P)/FAD-dependent oxidoreductase n=1 Tax=Phytomonospora sp. NPDC050363 TaxID=3155642 RepID=UPI0033CC60CC
MGKPRREHAVVIGAGVAGLATAAALAGRYAQVTVLDRDTLGDSPVPRRGVPQSEHGHILLAAGERALGELFDDLVGELVEAGAVPFDPSSQMAFHRWGALWPDIPGDLHLVSFSRPLLEWAARRRIRALPNATVRDGTAVSDLTGAEGTVTGVVLGDGTELACDLVVDCTGRGSRSDRWLSSLGVPAPRATEVRINVGYATRLFRRLPGDIDETVCHFALPSPPDERRTGLALPIEGDRWLITMGGWHGDFPDTDEKSFLAHAESLPLPSIARLIAEREPLSDLVVCGFPSSRRRHFEELNRLPSGYLALGDAVCSFNPIYGQGMTCAALEALALGRLLDRREAVDGDFAAEFYREAARIIATPWQFAVGGDFAYPQTRGERPRGIGLVNWFGRQVQLGAMVDPDIRRLYMSVQQLLVPPTVLRRPGTVLAILRAARRARRALPVETRVETPTKG